MAWRSRCNDVGKLEEWRGELVTYPQSTQIVARNQNVPFGFPGQWLQGGNNYTLRVPANAPAKQFWAMTLYDTETRSFIDTKHDIAGLDSKKDLVKNEDGSVDLYFGPEAPQGKEKNWIPTAPGRGWFAYFRLYAPTEAYFDRSWKLPDLVHVK